jgi:hypothetical protein
MLREEKGPTKISFFFPEEYPGLALVGDEYGRLSSLSFVDFCSGVPFSVSRCRRDGFQRPQKEMTVGVAVSWNSNLERHEVGPRVGGCGVGPANRFRTGGELGSALLVTADAARKRSRRHRLR